MSCISSYFPSCLSWSKPVSVVSEEQLKDLLTYAEIFTNELNKNTGDAAAIAKLFNSKAGVEALKAEGKNEFETQLLDALRTAVADYNKNNPPSAAAPAAAPVVIESADNYFAGQVDFRIGAERFFITIEKSFFIGGGIPRLVFGIATLVYDLAMATFNTIAAFFVSKFPEHLGRKTVEGSEEEVYANYRNARFDFVKHDAANVARGLISAVPVMGTIWSHVFDAQEARFVYATEELADN